MLNFKKFFDYFCLSIYVFGIFICLDFILFLIIGISFILNL
jgi:hypothetical protein